LPSFDLKLNKVVFSRQKHHSPTLFKGENRKLIYKNCKTANSFYFFTEKLKKVLAVCSF
jgi:hypothetical protein